MFITGDTAQSNAETTGLIEMIVKEQVTEIV